MCFVACSMALVCEDAAPELGMAFADPAAKTNETAAANITTARFTDLRDINPSSGFRSVMPPDSPERLTIPQKSSKWTLEAEKMRLPETGDPQCSTMPKPTFSSATART